MTILYNRKTGAQKILLFVCGALYIQRWVSRACATQDQICVVSDRIQWNTAHLEILKGEMFFVFCFFFILFIWNFFHTSAEGTKINSFTVTG